MIWCRSPKVATTTWARIYLQLFGVKKFGKIKFIFYKVTKFPIILTDHAGHYHSQMKQVEKRFVSRNTKKKYVHSLQNKQRKLRGFMIARHPMDRLFSAFRDKILRKSIIVKNINGNNKKPSFSKFLTFLAMNNPTGYNRYLIAAVERNGQPSLFQTLET